MGVAFFDFDETLIRKNSGDLWLRHEWRGGRIGFFMAARAATLLFRYKLGFVGLEAGIRLAIETLRGEPEDELRRRVQSFYENDVRHHYRDEALTAVRTHRAKGEAVVLLTSASIYVAEAVQADLGLDDVLCNRFEVDPDGRFTGEPIEPICFGDGKRELAARWLEARGLTWADAAFYTDSMADLPVLEEVARPVVVSPDPRLHRRAKEAGWPVLEWS
mgnify:CR=1 FL=1